MQLLVNEARRARILARRRRIERRLDPPGRGSVWFHPTRSPAIAFAIRRTVHALGGWDRGRHNARTVRIVKRTVPLPRLPLAFDGVTILQISDPHLDGDPAFPEILASRVEGLAYDLCAWTGDFRYAKRGGIVGCVRALERVVARMRGPHLAVLGNHDPSGLVEPLQALGIDILLNERATLVRAGEALHVGGVDDPHTFRTDDVRATFAGIEADACRILLAHSPEVWRRARDLGVDLVLCGHTHGGQIALPGGVPLFVNARSPRRVARGRWRVEGIEGYTSLGAGVSFVPVRFQAPAEVVLHRLVRTPSAP